MKKMTMIIGFCQTSKTDWNLIDQKNYDQLIIGRKWEVNGALLYGNSENRKTEKNKPRSYDTFQFNLYEITPSY